MRLRPGHLAFLIFQILWLVVIVPGHRRGSVPLLGRAVTCCRCTNTAAGNTPTKPAGGQSDNCAICFFTAHLIAPPVIDLTPAPLRPLHRQPTEVAHVSVSRILIMPFDGRGPPPLV